MNRQVVSSLLLILWALSGATAVRADEDPLSKMNTFLYQKDWEGAFRAIAKAEKQGLCKGAVCPAWSAIVAERSGDTAKALEQARQAVPLFGPDSGLDARLYNDLGVVFYRVGKGDKELLQFAEKALRNAEAVNVRESSNPRFNLAKVLEAQGRKAEAKALMDKLQAEGILIDPQMAVLGDFQRPGI